MLMLQIIVSNTWCDQGHHHVVNSCMRVTVIEPVRNHVTRPVKFKIAYLTVNEIFDNFSCDIAIFIISRLHDQNKIGFFGGPTFIQPIRAILKVFKNL